MTVDGFIYISTGCPSLKEIVINDMATLSDGCVVVRTFALLLTPFTLTGMKVGLARTNGCDHLPRVRDSWADLAGSHTTRLPALVWDGMQVLNKGTSLFKIRAWTCLRKLQNKVIEQVTWLAQPLNINRSSRLRWNQIFPTSLVLIPIMIHCFPPDLYPDLNHTKHHLNYT